MNVQFQKKNIMKTEIGLAIGFIVALTFKFMHWPFAGILSVLFLGGLALTYLFGGFFYFRYGTGDRKSHLFSILSGVVLSLIPIGILFKIQHWPGAAVLLLAAIVATPVLLAFSIIQRRNSKPELSKFYGQMVVRSSVLALAVFLLALVNMANW